MVYFRTWDAYDIFCVNNLQSINFHYNFVERKHMSCETRQLNSFVLRKGFYFSRGLWSSFCVDIWFSGNPNDVLKEAFRLSENLEVDMFLWEKWQDIILFLYDALNKIAAVFIQMLTFSMKETFYLRNSFMCTFFFEFIML